MRTHGNASTYRHGCRCDKCKTAHTERAEQERARRRARGASNPEKIPHGTYGYTNWGCRCTVCTAANTAAGVNRRARRRETAS